MRCLPHRLVLDRDLPNDGIELRRCFKLEKVGRSFRINEASPGGGRGKEDPCVILTRRDPIQRARNTAIGHLTSWMTSGVWMVNIDLMA